MYILFLHVIFMSYNYLDQTHPLFIKKRGVFLQAEGVRF